MRGVFGIATIALAGVIIADMVANPEGVRAAGSALDSILKTTFGAMLGKAGI